MITAPEISSSTYPSSTSHRRFLPRISHTMLLLLIAVAYSGAVPLLFLVSRYLLYGVYAAFIACIFVCAYSAKQSVDSFKSVLPYATWIIVYCTWGTLISPLKDEILLDAVRVIAMNLLILAAIAVALANSTDLSRLAQMIQVVAIVNCALSIWGGEILSNLSEAYIPNRPGGLWINPNGAAFFLLFALFLSYWARGPLAWIGRCAAIIGIYLAASRTIVYLLLLCTLFYLVFALRSTKLTPLRLAILFYGLALILGLAWLLSDQAYSASSELSQTWNIQRLLDISESDREFSGDISRRDVVALAARDALDGPLYGWGLFSFQRSGIQPGLSRDYPGAHNIYLVVWGETGIFGLLVYLFILAQGLTHAFRANITSSERLVVMLMWISYLAFGLTSHNMFSSLDGILGAALLYQVPSALAQPVSRYAYRETNDYEAQS